MAVWTSRLGQLWVHVAGAMFSRFRKRSSCCVFAPLVLVLRLISSAWGAGEGQLDLNVIDQDTGKPVPCRMHLKTAAGRPKIPKKVAAWDDHFVVPGKISLKLPLGSYIFEIERGPEYPLRTGHFTINRFAEDSKDVPMKRFVDMSADGWWSGDLDVQRSPKDIQLLMQAEDLHVATLTTWSNDRSEWSEHEPPKQPLVNFDRNRWCHLLAGQHVRPGGTLLYLNLPRPMKLDDPASEFPPIAALAQRIHKQPEAWVDISRPYWWDLPMLVANGQIDSIQIANSNLGRSKVVNVETGGSPRDKDLYASAQGSTLWSQDIYFHLLNCGLRIPPSAGSGSGVAPNPVGYNRMYVHVEAPMTWEKWWENFRAGRVTVTNGPLMRPEVHGQFPGYVFTAEAGTQVDLEIGLTLSLRDPITYMEIVKDARVEHLIRFDQYKGTGRLPKVKFDRSGWFLVRAVADVAGTYRFAMTAPYYVEIGGRQSISKRSAQFFLDWVVQRARQVHLDDAPQQTEVLQAHRKARDFWKDILTKANVE